MKILDKNMPQKPEINYPTQWGFKIIGKDKEALEKCIKYIMKETGDKKHTCNLSNQSRTGKFHSFNASCMVESEEERNKIFKYFSDHDDVDMVI
ncbi:Proposed lipoate regulatory protein YbeD [hydrothermal vent metagenome]|uniref:Proposed lipoate regulatory protein YbeD n=1 Tax=hydrothermal vent metagenome TaxID=652676 RepID=A0A1W1CCF0_9ZZZZ